MKARGQRRILPSLCAAVLLAACGAGTDPQPSAPAPVVPSPAPSQFEQVQAIVQLRCVTCHSVTPSMPGFSAAPRGIRFDTPEQIRADAQRIYYNVVTTEFMPYGNRTNMTPAERAVIGAWYEGGAK
jgi:uncharacterized membrane protein